MKKFRKDQGGFTLIELMIVIAIIGILAAIAIPNFLAYKTKGEDQAVVSMAKNFYNTALAYFADPAKTATSMTYNNLTSEGLNDDPNVSNASPTIVELTDGGVSLTNSTFWYQAKTGRAHTLNTDGSVDSP